MQMRVIKSSLIPFKGFMAINIFGIIVARKDCLPLSNRTLNHEAIHSKQINELFYIGFYIWYIVEWLMKLLYIRNLREAYEAISFEKEAFANQANERYLDCRKAFSFFKYIK